MADWGNGSSDQWGGNGGSTLDAGASDQWGSNAGGNFEAQCNGCGQVDHTIDSCPNGVPAAAGLEEQVNKCFACGEKGHRRDECPHGTESVCFVCKNPGHISKECPDKPPMVCNNCGEEGHRQNDCEGPRKINRDHVADIHPDEAWKKLVQAAKERDVDDAKEALAEYVKALDGAPTYREIQEGLINAGINLWLIGIERELIGSFTNMDLQGNCGKKYTVSIRFSEKAGRGRERDGWPQSREEILSRLDDAGEAVNNGKSKCYNCDEFGHSQRDCPQPKNERVQEPVLCRNCNGEGHKLRDCPQPRVDKFACKNCGKSGHKAAECEEPPNLDNMTCRKCEQTGHIAKHCPQGGGGACRNCGQEGHIAKECDQPRNMDTVTCRNCEKTGHFSRDCPEPKDWSKVQCTNCQEFGHTKVRCKKPSVEETDFGQDAGGFGVDNTGSFDTGGIADDGWGNANAVAVGDFSGGGGW